ncbi:single-stranded DNA-binding protein [Bacteroides cellulosilyticus]|jgi:single-stranded DNA-binding protein|uniref:single-stranded DNA-binding protein n=1 Tax=Bacteroides cellulosilyticus TaxID=246787 RepID=UPI0022E3602D|nr:single-stranded DNA-binding protein [Bacteroides cellulosilyticus]
MKRANSFEITGNCVADAKISVCANGREKASFSIAMNHLYETTPEGEKKTIPEYFNIEVWNKQFFELIKKGVTVTIKGFRKAYMGKEKPYFFIVATNVEKFVPDAKE